MTLKAERHKAFTDPELKAAMHKDFSPVSSKHDVFFLTTYAALLTSSRHFFLNCVTGAVAVRLRAYDSGLCFICAHLASGEAEGDELKRNYDYSEIVRRGQFPQDTASLDPESDINGSSSPAGALQVSANQPVCANQLMPAFQTDRLSNRMRCSISLPI